MLSTVMILAGCSKNEGGEGEPFTPPAQEQLTQNAYADNENTGGGFSFTADAPWTATVDEVKPQAPASVQAKSVTRAAGNNGNNVVWLKLYNGDKEAYSGGAGTITLRIEIDQNYTGERREATITIRSGNNTFTVTVVQEGTKQDGSENEPPVKVTKITLDKTELSLEAGAKTTLTATVEPADDPCTLALRDILFGRGAGAAEGFGYTCPAHKLNHRGTATGTLRGGNLSVFYGLRGTPLDIPPEDTILYIEDVGERPHAVERMLYNLRLGGVLGRLKGLIIGQFTEYVENKSLGKDLYGALADVLKEYDMPVCFNFPVGHVTLNVPLVNGARVTLEVGKKEARLSFALHDRNT